jgi:hypothetical protein
MIKLFYIKSENRFVLFSVTEKLDSISSFLFKNNVKHDSVFCQDEEGYETTVATFLDSKSDMNVIARIANKYAIQFVTSKQEVHPDLEFYPF